MNTHEYGLNYLILIDESLIVFAMIPLLMVTKGAYCNCTGRLSAGLLLLAFFCLHMRPRLPLSPLNRKLLNVMCWGLKCSIL